MIITINDYQLFAFKKQVEKLVKLMKKYDKKYTIELISKTSTFEHNIMENTYKYNIEFEAPKEGVNYLGAIKYIKDAQGNFSVRIFSNTEKSIQGFIVGQNCLCDSCNSTRLRNIQHIFEEEGEIKRLGSSCVEAYFGFDVDRFTHLLETLVDTSNPDEEKRESWLGLAHKTYKLEEIFTILNQISHSWKVGYDKETTYFNFMRLLNQVEDLKEVNISALSEKVREFWMSSIDSDFAFNVKKALFYKNEIKKHFVDKEIKLVICGILSALAPRKIKTISTSPKGNFVGELKEKRVFNLVLRGVEYCSTDFGLMTIYTFEDENENTIIAKTSGSTVFFKAMDIEKKDSYKISGTIKAHSLYNNINQTYITRCKVL